MRLKAKSNKTTNSTPGVRVTRYRVAFMLAVAAIICPIAAFSADYKAEYDNKIKTAQDIGTLGNDMAGDSVNLFSGAVSFAATDISAPSNGMAISLSRSYDIEHEHMLATVKGDVYNPEIYSTRSHRFGNWDLNVPRITTVMTQTGGWIVDSATPTNRCTVTGQQAGVPPVVVTPRLAIDPADYWSGYTLFAGGKQQSLLAANQPNNERPSAGGPYYWTTNGDWWVSCLSSLAGPTINQTLPGGQGFLAISPDGTKYTFNWLSKHNISAISKTEEADPNGYGTHAISRVFRAEYEMLATRVEDRFGNWTAYTWSNDEYPKLLSITSGVANGAADQTITLGYELGTGFIDSATVVDSADPIPNPAPHKWQYQYVSGSLDKVILPDGTFWQYSLPGDVPEVSPYCEPNMFYPLTTEWFDACFGGGATGSTPVTGYVIHPSGARIDFGFDTHFLFNNMMGAYPLGIASKTISGPGLTPATWTYDYFPTKQQLHDQCFSSAGCPNWLMRDERAPDGSLTRRIFGLDSVLRATLQGGTSANSGGGSPALTTTPLWGTAPITYPASATGTAPYFYKEVDLTYVPDAQATFTVTVGTNPLGMGGGNSDTYASQRRSVVKTTTQILQATTFVSDVPLACGSGGTALCMDVFAMPTRRIASSTGGSAGNFAKTETATYQHDYAKWVVGLVTTTGCINASDCNGSAGRVTGKTDYDSTTLLPWKVYGFDQVTPTATLTYNSNGSVATAKDARNFTTTLGALTNYKRGVPQSILLPDSTSIGADVGDLGQIKRVADQFGSWTCYGYDIMLRVSSITYTSEAGPGACTTTWTATSLPFVPVGSAEYGIPAGHWKRTTSTGNGVTTTYYDALWRPVLVKTEDTQNTATRSFVVNRFDGLNRKVFSSYPVGSLTSVNDAIPGVRTSYDTLGRTTQVQQDDGATPGAAVLNTNTTYVTGFNTQVVNPRGFATTTSYQAYDQPSQDLPRLIALPEGVTTTIDRQPSLGKALRITRSGTYGGSALSLTRRYAYDANDRLCETFNPESNGAIQDYDAAGNVSWSADGQSSTLPGAPVGPDGLPTNATLASICATDRAGVPSAVRISRTYDQLNRETLRSTPGGVENVATTYAPDGKVTQLVASNPGSNTITSTYTYNRRRLLTRETIQVNSNGAWGFDYGYDTNGHLSSQTYPGALTVGYAPDALGRATQVGTFASGVTYYPTGAISGFTYGNGIIHTMTPNARQLPAHSVDAYGGTKFLDDTYTYDANGNVMSMTDASSAPATDNRTWGVAAVTLYDGLDRLWSVNGTNWGTTTGGYNARYMYDPLDNIRLAQLGGSSYTHAYDLGAGTGTNRLVSMQINGGTTYTLGSDAAGNITSDLRNGHGYLFDAAHRLNAVTGPGAESYLYDGNGRRARTLNSTSGAIEYFGYGQDGRLLQDWSNRRNVRNGYIYLGNTLVALYEVNILNGTITPKYKHTDALGSPIVTTDANRNTLGRSAFTPYGVPMAPVDGVGYTGHFNDVGTGLTYMQQRYYDPQIGRFLSVDPIQADSASGTNFNRFWYANDNPIGFTDPDGRQSRAAAKCERDEKAEEIWGNIKTVSYVPSQPSVQVPYRDPRVPAPASFQRNPSIGHESPSPSVLGFLADRVDVEVATAGAHGIGGSGSAKTNLSGSQRQVSGKVVLGEGRSASAGLRAVIYDGGQKPGYVTSFEFRVGNGIGGGFEASWDAEGTFQFDLMGGFQGGSGVFVTTPAPGVQSGNLAR